MARTRSELVRELTEMASTLDAVVDELQSNWDSLPHEERHAAGSIRNGRNSIRTALEELNGD